MWLREEGAVAMALKSSLTVKCFSPPVVSLSLRLLKKLFMAVVSFFTSKRELTLNISTCRSLEEREKRESAGYRFYLLTFFRALAFTVFPPFQNDPAVTSPY